MPFVVFVWAMARGKKVRREAMRRMVRFMIAVLWSVPWSDLFVMIKSGLSRATGLLDDIYIYICTALPYIQHLARVCHASKFSSLVTSIRDFFPSPRCREYYAGEDDGRSKRQPTGRGSPKPHSIKVHISLPEP
jgi:hypothetical protein